MIISLCVPCHNRTYDLKVALPTWICAANASPPVEIVILNYNSPDDLETYILDMQKEALKDGNVLVYKKYTGRNYYHMAHARNLSVLASKGEYIVMLSADSLLSENFVQVVRNYLATASPVWMYHQVSQDIIVCKREEFIEAGGYDERFEFYGPEDRDLTARLYRRGGRVEVLPKSIFDRILTPDTEKVKNYRLDISKKEMSRRMRPIYEENVVNHVLIANTETGWGKWY